MYRSLSPLSSYLVIRVTSCPFDLVGSLPSADALHFILLRRLTHQSRYRRLLRVTNGNLIAEEQVDVRTLRGVPVQGYD